MRLNPTREQRRQLGRENAKQPAVMTPIPPESWPRWPYPDSAPPAAIWRSREFLAQLFRGPTGERLSVNRVVFDHGSGRWVDGMTWDDLQRVKNECGFVNRWAVEIYPPSHEVVNAANMRHLWLLSGPPPYGWRSE